MTNPESYVTKKNPTIGDWLDFNAGLFAALKGVDSDKPINYAPLADIDIHASQRGVSTEELFEEIRTIVGPLGRACLRLVTTEMDGASHVIIKPSDDTSED